MKKVLVVLVVACLAMAAFAGFKLNAGIGLQSSIGASYDFGKLEVGGDLRSFYPAYLFKIAKESDLPKNFITWFGGDVYALYEVFNQSGFSIDAGLGAMNNPYRTYNTNKAKETNWGEKKASNFHFLQTREFTFFADVKATYAIAEQHAVSLFVELPLLGITTEKVQDLQGTEFNFGNYLLSSARLLRVQYTYTF